MNSAYKWIPCAFALGFFAVSAAAQTLIITNGVQTYNSVSNTIVTMTGASQLNITGTNNPLFGATVNLNSSTSWLLLQNIRPSVVISNSYLSHVQINGAAASSGSNCRVEGYVMGTVVIPYTPSITPLQIFSGPNFSGASAQLGLYTYYTNTQLGALKKGIGSFKLKRGYTATFSQGIDGTGGSENIVAQDGDLEVGLLSGSLTRPVNFVRVFPWHYVAKRGWADTSGVGGSGRVVKPYWFYDWGNGGSTSTDAEYAPMKWTASSGTGSLNNKQNCSELLGYNEPDSSSQANLSVFSALADWPNLMQWGLRVGAPAVSDSGVSGEGLDWIHSFVTQATNLGYRLDFVPIHWYKCGQSAQQLTNYLAGVAQQSGRPVWITEFNYGANWCDTGGSQPPTPAAEATAVSQMIAALENAPFVERYSIYNWVTTNREMVLDDGVSITPAGILYRDTPTTMSYLQTLPAEGNRGIAQYNFEANTLDSSGYGNNAMAVGNPNYTPGYTGLAITLDGTNSYLQLPPSVTKGNAFSFAAWIYWNGGGNWQRIFDFGDDTDHYIFFTPSSGSGTLRLGIKNGGSEQTLETTVLPIGQWTHVAVTLSVANAKIYTNGVLASSSSGITLVPGNFTPAKNYLGRSQFAADPKFNGSYDEVEISDTLLSAAQIASLMTNTPPQFSANFVSFDPASPFAAFSTNVAGLATDADPDDSVVYSKATGPAWLTVGTDGTLSGVPGVLDYGTNYFTIRATDTAGASAYTVASVAVDVLTNFDSGVWISDADGAWGDASKWSGGVVANGGDGPRYTANFSTLNISANRTVALNSTRRIGFLRFGDTSGAQNWLLTNTAPGCILTLDTGSASMPVVTVSQNTANLAVPIAGSNGFAKTGNGTLILSNANTISGTVYIDTSSTSAAEGIVRAAYPGSLQNVTNITIRNNNSGSSTLQLDGSSGGVASGAAINVSGRNNSVVAIQNLAGSNTLSGIINIFTGGGSYLFQSDAGQLTLGGVLTAGSGVTGNRTFTFQGTGNFWISGSIQNGPATNGVTKTGAGTLTFAGVNTYTNTTTVSGGALLVNGTNGPTPVTVASTATLGGRGVLRGPVTVQSSGTLAPGTNASSIGLLTVSNSVTLQSGSLTRMKLVKSPAKTNDVLRVTSTLTYAGTLWVTNLGGNLTAGDSFRLFTAQTYNNSFNTFVLPALGAGLAWNTTGLTNGTISVIATALPQFASVSQSDDGNFQFSGTGAAGVTYELDAATNLVPPILWLFITNTVADQNGFYQLFDLDATNFPSRFYRIIGSQ